MRTRGGNVKYRAMRLDYGNFSWGSECEFCHLYTVNREYFDVKIFSDSMACAKIKRTKYMRNINDNAVQGCLSENYLTRKIIA